MKKKKNHFKRQRMRGFLTFAAVLTGSVYYLGAAQTPIVARKLGRQLGRSVVFLQQGKNTVQRAINHHDLNDMQGDLQKDIGELKKIRADIKRPASAVKRKY